MEGRFRLSLAGLVVLFAGAVAGCGSSAASIAPSVPPPSELASPSPSPTPTEAPTVAPSPTPTGFFIDPAGGYALTVGPDWVHEPSGTFSKGIEFWLVGTAENGFAPNVSILAQTTGGLDLAGYAAASLRSAPALITGFKLVSSTTIVSSVGPMLRFEYLGTYRGVALHFLAFAVVSDGTAYVATFTTPMARYTGLVAEVEPYLLTLASLPSSSPVPSPSP